MQSKTETILLDLLPRLRRDYVDARPEVALHRREFEILYEDFRRFHRNNPQLLRTVDDLLYAQVGWQEADGDCRFLLGLRMGLDLGRLDILTE